MDYLADRPGREKCSLEIGPAVYTHDSNDRAEQRLYGVLGAFGRWSYRYGKKEWFFTAYRKRHPDGSLVLLCWRLGEEAVTSWHTLDGGFAGRKPLPF